MFIHDFSNRDLDYMKELLYFFPPNSLPVMTDNITSYPPQTTYLKLKKNIEDTDIDGGKVGDVQNVTG
jgi:hypothetical protein